MKGSMLISQNDDYQYIGMNLLYPNHKFESLTFEKQATGRPFINVVTEFEIPSLEVR